ncbi:PSD1 and planctomycete cytochrome C domain-containing protein [Planctomyces sp. SH-PL62]|uniref:PSD1 and planctomycete cytochrome C domain-containing protein n=1 Tax=Planctomyces sp. SH-PL62 TaxID=1636152 RepID=UPI00078B3D5F|nr:PSD1 and planctomycete cytochrome C domain-containing protein [Planctomyces sp. SH-PL62]AMV38228.1 Planctomycete cytochrome C [Planctomyces sp. SH-PL62]
MNATLLRLRSGLVALLLLGGARQAGADPTDLGPDPARAQDSGAVTAAGLEFFEKQVRPLLVERCYECHSSGAKAPKGGLSLDDPEGWVKGGDSGPAVVPGSPDESLLIDAVRYGSLEMPPRGKLPALEIAVLERWVGMGAPAPPSGNSRPRPAPATSPDEAARSHWAFRPIADPPAPLVKDAGWPRSDVDRFILAKLESEGLSPVGDADKMILLRRVHFDLVGLPPTSDEIASFLSDGAPDALEKVVDALLARPTFGQRWGRHWLDVARYADSNGSCENFTFYDAWRYRNYVVDAYNADKPFDRFIAEQLAGDLLPSRDQRERDANLVATGFLVIGPKGIGATDKEQLAIDVIDEQLDTIGKVFLGLSVGCARCHDHKFDPISTADYYGLAGILASTETTHGYLLDRKDLTGWNLHPLGADGQEAYEAFQAFQKKVGDLQKEEAELKAKLETLKGGAMPAAADPSRAAAATPTPDAKSEVEKVEERLAAVKEQLAQVLAKPAGRPPMAMSVNDHKQPGPVAICIRGDAHNRGAEVPRGFIAVVEPSAPAIRSEVSGRVELAEWLASPRNPLTARVAVNRIWQHVFGRGLVGSPDDFGTRGERPSHPELLDYLARRFMQQGWSVKGLVRGLVLSRTYRQSSEFDRACADRDPENRWHWRANRRRLDMEALRDGLLAASGRLDPSPTDSVVAKLNLQATGVGVGPNPPFVSARRTVYLPVIRNDLPPLFQLFDFGDALSVNGRRSATNVAPQALFMMNSPLVLDAAKATTETVLAGCETADDLQTLERLYVRIVGRPPRRDEVAPSLALVHERLDDVRAASPAASAAADDPLRNRAWAALAHVLFCSTSYQYVD